MEWKRACGGTSDQDGSGRVGDQDGVSSAGDQSKQADLGGVGETEDQGGAGGARDHQGYCRNDSAGREYFQVGYKLSQYFRSVKQSFGHGEQRTTNATQPGPGQGYCGRVCSQKKIQDDN